MMAAAHAVAPRFPRYAGRDAAAARAFVAQLPRVGMAGDGGGGRRDRRGLPIVPNWCAEVIAAKPPTVAAWRLAWWLRATRTRPAALERLCVLGPGAVIRMLNGEMAPVDISASLIAHHSEGAVRVGDWCVPFAGAGWFDVPHVRGRG